MDDLLDKYNIRYKEINLEYTLNFSDISNKLLDVKTKDDKTYIPENEFIDLVLENDNSKIKNINKFNNDYVNDIIDGVPDEIIKPLKNYEKYYNISSDGYVISLRHNRTLKPNSANTYYSVSVTDDKKTS